MTVLISLTPVRYPPRDLIDRTGDPRIRVPAGRLVGALFALTWFPAGFFIASGVVDGALMWPTELDAWLALAALVPGGLPLALACGALWRRGHGVAALMVLALVPAIAAGSLVVALFGPIALVAFAAVASLPAWLLYAYMRLFRQWPRRERRRAQA